MAAISSWRFFAARLDMLAKKKLRIGSGAPLSARLRVSRSTWRIRVWMLPGSSLARSSKVNMRARIFFAASRFIWSRAERKRASVCRSKALNTSAMVLCASLARTA